MEKEKNSVTFDLTLPSGVSALFTVRDTERAGIKDLLDTMISLDKAFIEKGIKPHVRSAGGFPPKKEKEWIEGKCPKDGGRMYHIVTKTGKDMCKCENSTYIGGVAGGCDFVLWAKGFEKAVDPTDAF